MPWWRAWRDQRKLKALRREFRYHQAACAECGKNHNPSGHQLHFKIMRELYAKMRKLDPSCPSWNNNRAERRREAKRGRKMHRINK